MVSSSGSGWCASPGLWRATAVGAGRCRGWGVGGSWFVEGYQSAVRWQSGNCLPVLPMCVSVFRRLSQERRRSGGGLAPLLTDRALLSVVTGTCRAWAMRWVCPVRGKIVHLSLITRQVIIVVLGHASLCGVVLSHCVPGWCDGCGGLARHGRLVLVCSCDALGCIGAAPCIHVCARWR
jgi:hypothetical protein